MTDNKKVINNELSIKRETYDFKLNIFLKSSYIFENRVYDAG
jgi:hypothetical protein